MHKTLLLINTKKKKKEQNVRNANFMEVTFYWHLELHIPFNFGPFGGEPSTPKQNWHAAGCVYCPILFRVNKFIITLCFVHLLCISFSRICHILTCIWNSYTSLTGYRESEDRQARQTIPRCENSKCDCSQVVKSLPSNGWSVKRPMVCGSFVSDFWLQKIVDQVFALPLLLR